MRDRTIRRQMLRDLEAKYRKDRVMRHNLTRLVERLPVRARIAIKVGVWLYRLRQFFNRTTPNA